ncbi:MAG: hypothetical protein SWC96_00175 [Thermodesulfobacteriota bacterium]|nr:hypothetical protein [Thermodesulfobacteriota bacterium]
MRKKIPVMVGKTGTGNSRTLGEEALAYRRQRGLDRSGEQMALLVQRVSGAYHKSCFSPELAGAGLSRNPS